MAKIKFNALVDHLSGSLGDLVFRRLKDRTIVLRRPDMSRRVLSEAQHRQIARFREATAYAKTALADPRLRALYQAAAQRTGKPANSLAATDFLKPPSIDTIDARAYRGSPGDPILITVGDTIEAASVHLAIRSGGATVEQGSAILQNDTWHYTAQTHVDLATVSLTFEVTARDHPGNVTTRTDPN